MKFFNVTKNTILAENVRVAVTLQEKMKGLLGAREPYPLLLKTRWGIHTFGMQFPIDVIVFDSRNVVRAIKENMQPNSFFFWNPRYENVLELSEGVIKHSHASVGDVLEIKPHKIVN